MTPFQTKTKVLPGTNYKEINKRAWRIYHEIEKRTKRKPYIRSAYFDKEKIFFDFFFIHVNQKKGKDKLRRLRYFNCAIELIQNSRIKPSSIENPNNQKEILHKFNGRSREGNLFYVHIKENKKTGRKYFMSCFPEYK